jgi:hypothetical protein
MIAESQTSGDNLNSVRHEIGRILGARRGSIWKKKFISLKQMTRKILESICRYK